MKTLGLFIQMKRTNNSPGPEPERQFNMRSACLVILGSLVCTGCFVLFPIMPRVLKVTVPRETSLKSFNGNDLNDGEEDEPGGVRDETRYFYYTTKQISSPVKKYTIPQRRVVHLDLKGAAPNLKYLREVLPLMRKAGANTLLIEYEDMFPYWGPLASTTSSSAYSSDQIRTIMGMAKNNSLQVIPLLQTFGHMEHILKFQTFSHLREHQKYPQSICPSKNDSLSLIKTMIDQVMVFHQGSTDYIHIGCDEVVHLGICPHCKSVMRKMNHVQKGLGTPRRLYLEHVKEIATYVQAKYQIKPLIWDDMIRSIPMAELKAFGLGEMVEPMVWVYAEEVPKFIDVYTWRKYVRVFKNIWVAGSFKGAFGERLLVPPLRRHSQNLQSWLDVIGKERSFLNFRGIVLTGWSRYDHFASLCELLPTAIPSLVLGLVKISTPANGQIQLNIATRLLGCPFTYKYSDSQFDETKLNHDLKSCQFPGRQVFEPVVNLNSLHQELDNYLRQVSAKGWITPYHKTHNYTSTWRLAEIRRKYQSLDRALESLHETLTSALSEIFDESMVSEWMEQNVEWERNQTMENLSVLDSLKARTIWGDRPH
eukprot:TCALIF_10614-PA protein Name:"Similar to HEXDC Hexosaminidase D (Homo sapiens)" AED:0.13 eAED:0.13 QI:0/0.4/0.33/0.5/0.4/0.5/6/936/592